MKSSKREILDNDYLLQGSMPVIDKRFEVCLKWYIRKSCFYKKMYYITTLSSSIIPVIMAALNGIGTNRGISIYMTYIITILSIMSSISTIVFTAFRAQEKWVRYRSAAEYLKKERSKYLARKMQVEVDPQLDEDFLKTIEAYMEQENLAWREENSDKKNSRNTAESRETEEPPARERQREAAESPARDRQREAAESPARERQREAAESPARERQREAAEPEPPAQSEGDKCDK